MSVTEQINEVIAEKLTDLSKDADFRALSAFYEAAKRDGIVKAPEYSLPLVDTIGRGVGKTGKTSRSHSSRHGLRPT